MDKVLVYDNKIYILDAFVAEKVFIFDKRGVLLKTIDNKGQGPDEYAGLSGMSIVWLKTPQAYPTPKPLCL